jgi:aryl-alcohol dehydrogenase-like predicted oxidoreductase
LDHTPEELERVRAGLGAFVTLERSAAQLALRYSLAHPAVATVIPGASRAEQLMENVGAAEVILSAQEHRELQGLARANRYTQHR